MMQGDALLSQSKQADGPAARALGPRLLDDPRALVVGELGGRASAIELIVRKAGCDVTTLSFHQGADAGKLSRKAEGMIRCGCIDILVIDATESVADALAVAKTARLQDWALPIVLIGAPSMMVAGEVGRLGLSFVASPPRSQDLLRLISALLPGEVSISDDQRRLCA